MQHGKINTTIRQLKDSRQYNKERKAFQAELASLKEQFGFQLIIAERYMPRGQFAGMGNAQELIPMMLSALECMELAPILFISAAAWKNEVKRFGEDLKQSYLELKDVGITAHQIDASHMAVYGLHKVRKLPYKFDLLTRICKAKAVDIGEPFVRPKKAKRRKRSTARA